MKMKSSRGYVPALVPALLAAVLTVATPMTSHAQSTLTECLDEFDTKLDAVLLNATSIVNRQCTITQGNAFVALVTTQPEGNVCRFRALFIRETRGVKQCRIDIVTLGITPCTIQATQEFSVGGRVLARWRKFLQGDGCQSVMNAALP